MKSSEEVISDRMLILLLPSVSKVTCSGSFVENDLQGDPMSLRHPVLVLTSVSSKADFTLWKDTWEEVSACHQNTSWEDTSWENLIWRFFILALSSRSLDTKYNRLYLLLSYSPTLLLSYSPVVFSSQLLALSSRSLDTKCSTLYLLHPYSPTLLLSHSPFAFPSQLLASSSRILGTKCSSLYVLQGGEDP